MTQTSESSHVHTTHCWWNPDEARWACTPGDAVSTNPLVDVRDMIVVHTALLREFRLAPAAVGRVAAGDTASATAVERHLALLCDLLHHHHEGEDTLLWPLLRERVPAAAQAILDEIESQHAGLDASLGTVAAARQRWVREPDVENRDHLAGALGRLHTLLRTHLDLEESAVLPLAASVVTEAEWHAVGAAGAASVPKRATLLVFGMFGYEGDPAVLRAMLSSAPAPVRRLLPSLSARAYGRRARQLYGTAQP